MTPSIMYRAKSKKAGPLTFVLLGTILSSSACRSPSAPTREQIEKAFAVSAESAGDPKSGPVSDLDVYIDGSMSMRGYANVPNSHYIRVVRHILNSGTSAGRYNLVTYKVANGIVPIDDLGRSQITLPGFYNGLDTPLSALFTRIAGKPYSDHISIIVTDMVQSEKGKDQIALMRSLQEIASRKLEIQLLGFRSAFIGDYYIESGPRVGGRQKTLAVRLGEDNPGLGRPFYVLVLSPNHNMVDLLERYILERAGAPQSFNPMDAPLRLKEITFEPERRPVWNPHAPPEYTPIRSSGSRQFVSFLEVRSPESSESPLGLRVPVDIRVPLNSADKIRFEADKASFKHGSFTGAPVSVPLRISSEGGKETLALTYPFVRPEKGTWDVYRIRMRAGEGNLAAPKWVQDWSTDSDETLKMANRTFQLALLVEAMIRSITESTVFCEQYISVGRGN